MITHLKTEPIKPKIREQQPRKGSFTLNPEAKSAFEELKLAFTMGPVLVHFDQNRPIRVETDASGFAISGILTQPNGKEGPDQHWHPVAFWSRKMEPAELRYDTSDQELLAIVRSFGHWRHYLKGARFPVVVLTDHGNLQTFMITKELSRRQVQWAEKLSVYNIHIVYRSEMKNPVNKLSKQSDYTVKAKFDDINQEDLDSSLRGLQEQLKPHDMRSVEEKRVKVFAAAVITRSAVNARAGGTPNQSDVMAGMNPDQRVEQGTNLKGGWLASTESLYQGLFVAGKEGSGPRKSRRDSEQAVLSRPAGTTEVQQFVSSLSAIKFQKKTAYMNMSAAELVQTIYL